MSKVWKTLAHHSVRPGHAGEKTVVGPDRPQRCRVCGKGRERGATFNDEAHIIPAALGNRTLFCTDECDKCNHQCGESLDNALVDYLSPFRAIARLPGRRGFPKHRITPDKSFIHRLSGTETLYVREDPDSSTLEWIEHGNNTATLRVRQQKHRLVTVVKNLARLVLLSAKEPGPEFDNVREWVLNRRDYFGMRICTFRETENRDTIQFIAEQCTLANHTNSIRCRLIYPYVTVLLSFSLKTLSHSGMSDNDLFDGLMSISLLQNHDYRVVTDNSVTKAGWVDFGMSYGSRGEPIPEDQWNGNLPTKP